MSSRSIADWPPLTLWLTGLILALVVCVIVLPALCTACYHYISYKKGWDADDYGYDADLDSPTQCGSGGVQHYESIDEEKFRRHERWRYYMHIMQAANMTAAATAGITTSAAAVMEADDNHMISTLGTTSTNAARF